MQKAGDTILASHFVIQTTAGEALSARDSVYISTSDGKAYKTDADDSAKIEFVGFAQAAASTDASVNIEIDLQDGFSGLTRGPYYLSGTAGAITTTPPSSGHVVPIGRAVNTTTILIEKQRTRFPITQVFSGTSPTSFTDLDLSSVVGATRRMVMVKVVCGTIDVEFHFRRNGETGAHVTSSTDNGSGTAKSELLTSGKISYLIVPTDNAGIVEWATYQDGIGQASTTSTVTVEAYW